MIRLSKLADYSIVVVMHLARSNWRQLSASDVATQTRIPQPTVSKIMKTLSRRGILRSSRGVRGGYELAVERDCISVADVIEAIDGPIALTSCIDDQDDRCAIESVCLARPNWQQINEAIRKALAGITIHEMSQTIPPAFLEVGAGAKTTEIGAI